MDRPRRNTRTDSLMRVPINERSGQAAKPERLRQAMRAQGVFAGSAPRRSTGKADGDRPPYLYL
jgi:hypothetical protein